MTDFLLYPARLLSRHKQHVVGQAHTLSPPVAIDLSNPVYGDAFINYLLLSNWPAQVDSDLTVDSPTLFYNRYYWLRMFSKLYAEEHGPDAGLDQQAFQLLESTGFAVDWKIIKRIDEMTT